MKIILSAVVLLSLISCTEPESDVTSVEVSRVGGITIDDSIDQVDYIRLGMQAIDDLNVIYGLDARSRKLFKLSLESGSLEFLNSVGEGPYEMMYPYQLTIKNNSEFFVYDANMDNIAHFVDDEIIDKIPGYLEHNVWTRHSYGYYWNDHIISANEDAETIPAKNFDQAKPLIILSLNNNTLTRHGMMSPTADNLDSFFKYPFIYFHEESESIFYVFTADHSIMKYNLIKDSTYVASSYKAQKMRIRSIPVNTSQPQTSETEKIYGLDLSELNGLGAIDNQLIVVWQNATEEFYEDKNPEYLDVFGVIYDLPLLDNPRELSLPGRFLGTYKNYILVEENDDPLEYTIGYYEVNESLAN